VKEMSTQFPISQMAKPLHLVQKMESLDCLTLDLIGNFKLTHKMDRKLALPLLHSLLPDDTCFVAATITMLLFSILSVERKYGHWMEVTNNAYHVLESTLMGQLSAQAAGITF